MFTCVFGFGIFLFGWFGFVVVFEEEEDDVFVWVSLDLENRHLNEKKYGEIQTH